MTRETINPAEMYDAVSYGFSHAVAHEGRRVIECAGQVAWDDHGNLVGPGDFAAQTAQVFRNLRKVLAHCGAGPADVVRLRTFIVGHDADKLDVLTPALAAFYGPATPAANTLIGVQSLALPGILIEVDATAVVGSGA
ncbi:MAG: RidA family protein [Pseudomonadota bacterium]